MKIQELMQSENITLNIKSCDLATFANDIAQKILKQAQKVQPQSDVETYLTTNEVCEKLSVSRVTLFNWEKKGLLMPIRMGNLKRYKLSTIESIGNK